MHEDIWINDGPDCEGSCCRWVEKAEVPNA